MFLTSIRRKKKSSGQDSLTGIKKRRLNSENYPKTRKLIDELNSEEVFGENVKVCRYSRNEDVNQNVLNKEFIDVITIDVEVERVKNDVSKKKKDSSETKQDWLSIRTRGSPKVLYNLMKNLSPAQMKDIIDIGFGVSLGGEDINRMNRLGSEDVMTLEWHSQLSRKNPTPKKVYDKIQESRMGGVLFKLNFLVLFSNAMGLSEKGGQCRPGKSIIGYINEETKIEYLDWCKYVCMCLKMSKINWIRDGENNYYSGPLTALTLDSKMDKLDQKVTLLKLIVEDLEFEFSNGLMDHPNSSRLKDIKANYNGIIRNTDLFDFGYAIEDNSIHHESQYGNSWCRRIRQGFYQRNNKENEEDSSEEEMIEEDDIGNGYRKNEMIIINKDEDEFNVFNDIKPDNKDASIRVQPKRKPSISWYLKSSFKVRGSALNTYANTLSQIEVLTTDTLFILDEETDPIEIVYSSCTNNVRIPRLFLESLAPGLKIDEPVIDAWADLLNFNESYM
uniref:Uncharacterized protein n=1 Tax=Tanacetum cinerariifolium TaxID=118510 RepID=A0A699GVS3_TANCI|nr:hypothetical protein [Tanacetum cinerariifolium]